MPRFDLSHHEAATLIKELQDTIDNDRYPHSTRIRTPKAILAKLRPELNRQPLAAAEDACSAASNSCQKAAQVRRRDELGKTE